MSEPIVLPELDEDPKDNYWAPEVSEFDATDEEIAEGNKLGDITRDLAD